MRGIATDLRFALRQFRAQPGFCLAATLSLALGVGLNAAVFSVVDAVLFRRAPVVDLDRLMMIWETDRTSGTTREPASLPDYLDFRVRSRTIDELGSVMAVERNLTPAGEPVRLAALVVSSGLLPMLGLEPVVGRSFAATDDAAGAAPVALISESLWTRLFDRRTDILGQPLRLDDVPHAIVGVVPDVSDFGILQMLGAAAYSRGFADRGRRVRVDVWTPLIPDTAALPRSTHPIFVIGKLAPGATGEAAQAELAAIAADLEAAFPENQGRGVFVEPLGEVVFGPVRPALLVLWAAVGLVLLVACVNVATLLLARGTARAREIAVRVSLGSSIPRLARQFLAEALVLTAAGTAAGVALAFGLLRALLWQAPASLPRLEAASIDLRVLWLTAGASVLVAAVFGIVPTLQAMAATPHAALQSDAGVRGTAGRSAHRTRTALVIAELAMAVVLLSGAALLIQTFWRLQHVDAGFAAEHVLKAEYQLPRSRYPVDFSRFPDFAEQHAFTRALIDRALQIPGVESAAVAGNHPLDPGFTNSFGLVGRPDERFPEISVRRVTAGYFRTVGLALVSGRLLADADATPAPSVAVLNETAARRLFGDREPLGAQIAFWGARRTIVGIVRDERIHGLIEDVPIAVYVPLGQAPSANGAGVLLLRASANPLMLSPAARRVIGEVDPELAVFGVEPLTETVSQSIGQQRFMMWLLATFAGLALVLAAVGVHGVLSYNVVRRTREIGIRLALGADPHDVRRRVVLQGAAMALAGIAFGLAGAAALSRALRSLLYGVSPGDPATLAGVAALLVAVALAASAAPSYRATRIDATAAMRAET